MNTEPEREMMETKPSDELASFLASGIYRLDGSKVVFVDPVRLLSDYYTQFSVSPSHYYSRYFDPPSRLESVPGSPPTSDSERNNAKKKIKKTMKKRRKMSSPRDLNERERAADRRHQEARPVLVDAHEAFVKARDLVDVLPNLDKSERFSSSRNVEELDFVELGRVWQAPMYELSLCFDDRDASSDGRCFRHCGGKKSVPLFNNFIVNEASRDVEAEFMTNLYILPRKCCFHMSDLRQVHDLIPAHSDYGFNLIVIDPPWENGSVYQKGVYPTLPNKHLLYLPVKQLSHTEGALVALWMTNREKLRKFVEEELFPAWGVAKFSLLYWLKVKPDGSLIGELDLFHHRPYEYLLLGYVNAKSADCEERAALEHLQINQVMLSIPGSHSRKPPLGNLLAEHIPGPRPAKCIELFARDLAAGWTSWGNEPLRFQDSNKYFVKRDIKECTT